MDPCFDEDIEITSSIPYSNCWSELKLSKYIKSECLQYACQPANEGGEMFTNKKKDEEHDDIINVRPQTESTDESGPDNSTVNSIQSLMKCGSKLGSWRKISLLLLLLFILITPCGQPVGAQSLIQKIDSESFRVMLATNVTRNNIVTSTLTTSIVRVVQNMMCDLMDTPPIMTTGLILHPLYDSRSRVKDLLTLSSTRISLMLHPKYSTQKKATALIPVNVKDTSLIVHPHFSTSACKDLVILPSRPIPICKTVSSRSVGGYPTDIDSLLLITILDRHIKNQDYRHCSLSEYPGSICSVHDENEQLLLTLCRHHGRLENLYDNIDHGVPTKVNALGTPGPMKSRYGGNSDTFIAAVIIVSFIFLLTHMLVSIMCKVDNSSLPPNQGEYNIFPQYIKDETGPISTSHNHSDTLMSCSDMANQQCIYLDPDTEQALQACALPLEIASVHVTENCDSGFGSLDLNTSLQLSLTSHQSASNSIGNYDSGLGSLEAQAPSLHHNHQSIANSNEQILPMDTANNVQSLYDFPESEESDDEDDNDIRDEMALEAELTCLSSDQPLTLCNANLLQNLGQGCDTSSPSESFDCEEQFTATYNIHPVDITNEPNCNSDDINHSATMFTPITLNYNDSLYPRYEIEINVKLQGNEKMNGAAVTVESNYLQDLCSLASPPKPPDVNINQPFLQQYENHECSSVNMLQYYPNSIQETAVDPAAADGALPVDVIEDPDQNISENGNVEDTPDESAEFRPFEDISSDTSSCSEDGDSDLHRFNSSLQEEGPNGISHHILGNIGTQNTPTLRLADQPVSVFRGDLDPDSYDSSDSVNGDQQPDSKSIESEQPTNVLHIPTFIQEATARSLDLAVDGALPIPADVIEDPDRNISENGDVEDVPDKAAEFCPFEDISSDASSHSEDDDIDRFNSSLQEEGPKEPNHLSLGNVGTQNTPTPANKPVNVFRGDPDSCGSSGSANSDQEQHSGLIENDQTTNALPITMPINYDDPPHPHQENEIQVKLEATEDMQSAAVTVECSQFKDLTSLGPPPKPPDINVNCLFVCHRGSPDVRFLINLFQEDYPPPIQEAGHPLQLPTTSMLIGGISFALPPISTSGQSRVILPNLHPRSYINGVVV